MAKNQKYEEYRVNALPPENSSLKPGDNYLLNLGANKFRRFVVSDSLKLVGDAGAEFIEKDTMAEFRAITPREIWAIQNGYFKGVRLSGYYQKDDTPAPINYNISGTSKADDGGSVIDVGEVRFEHIFNGSLDVSYFGAGSSSNLFDVLNAIFSSGYRDVLISKECSANGFVEIPSNSVIRCSQGGVINVSTPSAISVFTITSSSHILFDSVNINMGTSGILMSIDASSDINIINSNLNGQSVFNEITKTWSSGALRGISISNNSSHINISGNVIKGFRGNHAIAIQESSYVKIKDNYISETLRAGVSINSGSSYIDVLNNDFRRNQCNFDTDGAIDIYGYAPACHDIRIEGNNIREFGLAPSVTPNCGIRIKDCYNVVVHNNNISIDYPLYSSIYIQDREVDNPILMNNIHILNNTIKYNNSTQYLLRINTSVIPAEDIFISDNTYDNPDGHPNGSFEIRSKIKGLNIHKNNFNLPNNTETVISFTNHYRNPSDRMDINISNNIIKKSGGNFTYFDGCSRFIYNQNILIRTDGSVGAAGRIRDSQYGVVKDNILTVADFTVDNVSNVTKDNIIVS